MGVTQHNEGTMNVTITDVKTDTNEATGSFTITEGSNYENITYTLTGDLTPGIKKIRFDFALDGDGYILNFNHVTVVKDDGGATAIEETNTNADAKTVKVIRNGQLVIIRDGVEYNALGNRL